MAIFRSLPRRHKRHNFFLLCIIVVYFLWVEFIALHFKALFWRVPKKTDDSATLLLVADPQLIGYRNEKHAIGWLTRWDSDRYTRRAFQKAFSDVSPDYVLFMGDLFDEGVQMQSSAEEFKWTLQRFNSIFTMNAQTKTIYIAGDNDVGGEMEHVSPMLQSRFDKAFPNFLKTGHAEETFEFSEVNLFGNAKPHKISKGDGLKILLSHVPVIRSVPSLEESLGNYKPDLILSAHDHTAEFYVKKSNSQQFSRHEASKGLRFSVSSGMPLVEIQVPTISYRMGVPEMAVGVLIVDFVPHSRAFTISYENLWLPGRYPQLYGYIFMGFFALIYLSRGLLSHIRKLLGIDRFCRRLYRRNSIKVYLPV